MSMVNEAERERAWIGCDQVIGEFIYVEIRR